MTTAFIFSGLSWARSPRVYPVAGWPTSARAHSRICQARYRAVTYVRRVRGARQPITRRGELRHTMATVYDIIIIGSGPSGYTAALYASRANLKVLQFQGYTVGGQLMLTSDVENYPGFVHGVMGPEMMDKFEEQAKRFGTEMIARDVV